MAEITAAGIKRLRELTGAGMSDCKRALVESDGDVDRAIETLRLKGAKDVGKREARTASNGLVTALVDGVTRGVLLELNCETDFVAKGERFQTLASQVVDLIAAGRPADLPALLSQPIAGDPGKKVQDVLDEANAALGEKIEIRRFAAFDGAYVAAYLHKTSPDLPAQVGVLVALSGENVDLGRDLAQHIAAMAPKYLSREQVPAETVDAERRLAEQMARDEGKPEAAHSKIVQGRVTGYFKDFCLLEQPFVKDAKRTIQQLLDVAGVSVTEFARFKVGQA